MWSRAWHHARRQKNISLHFPPPVTMVISSWFPRKAVFLSAPMPLNWSGSFAYNGHFVPALAALFFKTHRQCLESLSVSSVPAALGVEGARMIAKGASDSHKRACAVLIHKMCIHWQKSVGTLGEWCMPKLMLQESRHSQVLGGLAAKEEKKARLGLKSAKRRSTMWICRPFF